MRIDLTDVIKKRDKATFRSHLPEMAKQDAEYQLFALLNAARHEPAQEADFAEMMQALLDEHPSLTNLNTFVKYADRCRYYAVTFPNSKLPFKIETMVCENNAYHYRHHTYGETHLYNEYYNEYAPTYSIDDYVFLPCSPLQIAAIYHLTAVMKVLLAQPSIDVTLGSPYTLTGFLPSACKTALRQAHIKQLYRELAFGKKEEQEALVQKHNEVKISPKDMRHYLEPMVEAVIERMQKETVIAKKMELLTRELEQLMADTALKSFLGEGELKHLTDKITKKLPELFDLQAASATTAPTKMIIQDSTEEGGGINDEKPASVPAPKKSIFSIFKK